jgi:peptide/nickel transport system ATP-binding protein
LSRAIGQDIGERREPAAGDLLTVQGLSVWSGAGRQAHRIVSELDLTVGRGEAVGIVGESGSGKSMTARSLMRLLPRGVSSRGNIAYKGRDLAALSSGDMASVRGSGIAMLLQDPFTMLNPVMRCGTHIEESLRTQGGKRLTKTDRAVEIRRRLFEVGIEDARIADAYPFQLSGGMRQRVALAAVLAGDPDILIADEPSTALDVTTQKQILALMAQLQASRGMGLILITHDLRVAFSMCKRIYVLYAGSVLEVGDASAVEAQPLHPYTLGLLLSDPPLDKRLSTLPAMPGSVPSPDLVANSCAFAPRCAWARPVCAAGRPPLVPVVPGQTSACIRIDEIRDEMRAARAAADTSVHVTVNATGVDQLVSVDKVTKIFEDSGARGRHVALKEVSLEVGRNESVGLVGESGSGKTTLARCLVGLERPTEGRIRINGADASNFDSLSRDDLRRVRRTIQIVFQDPYSSLNPVRTVGAILGDALALYEHGGRDLKAATTELLERVGLPANYAARKPAMLSGGERQRVAIARALAVKPDIIVCDEPVSALDVSVQAQILNLFRAIQQELGISYLFITHDLAVVRQTVDRLYVLYRGEIVESGPTEKVLDHPEHPYTQRLVASVPRADATWLQS